MAASRSLDRTFKVSVGLKGVDGALELLGGLIVLVVSPTSINRIARGLTEHELSRDPHDFFARHVLHAAGTLSTGGRIFAAVYLLAHGAAKVVLVVAVLRNQHWAYPGMIILLVAFIVYQLYRLVAVEFSIGLTLLTIFDAFVVWLTWREYQAHQPEPSPA